jgi:UDP-2-acetamido-3-amino-2,3-dideoxy-glucuronate N-acetyltransferase
MCSQNIASEIFIHPTSIVEKGASIGKGSKIWHWVHICSGAKIGKNVSLGQNVFISDKAVVGDNCKVQNNVSLYDNVYLGDAVFCGPSVVFTNVINPRALIDRKSEFLDTKISNGVSIGANATIICGNTVGGICIYWSRISYY